jgi:hypothetical protein
MTTSKYGSASALVLLVLLSMAAIAQKPAGPADSPKQEKAADSNRKGSGQPESPQKGSTASDPSETTPAEYAQWMRAILLLRSTADDSKKWDDKSLAARIQSEVADLTWDADPGIAVEYLQMAWDTAASISDDPHPTQPAASYRSTSAKTAALRSVIAVARRRDPELAKKWIARLGDDNHGDASSPGGVFDDRTRRSAVLLQMAADTVGTDPKAAADLATQSVNDGISFGFQVVLIALQAKDFSLAQQVFKAALTRLQTVGMIDPNELLILASYLYTPGRVVGASNSATRGNFPLSMNRNASTITAAAQLDPAMAADFLRLSANLLINAPLPSATPDPVSAARTLVNAIGFLLPKIASAFPDLAQALQQRASQLEADANFALAPTPQAAGVPVPRPDEKPRDYAERRVDTLEDSAKKESSPMARDTLYAEAALATAPDHYQRGWTLAQNIQDDDLRPAVKDLVSYRAAVSFARADKLDRLEEVNARNNDNLYRAAALVLGAQRQIAGKNTVRAVELLSEASRSMRKAAPQEGMVPVSLGIAAAYARFDPIMAHQSIAEAVKLIDKFPSVSLTEDKAPLVRRFSGISFSDFTYGTSGFGLNSAIDAFPADDFEDLLGQLSKLSNPESRSLAIILLCRKFLSKARTPKPTEPHTSPSPSPPWGGR